MSVCVLLALSSAAGAQDEVNRLNLRGFPIEVAGRVLGFDGTHYRIQVPGFGTLRLDAGRYDCIGPGCAATPAATPRVNTAAQVAPASTLAPAETTLEATEGERVVLSDHGGVGSELLPGLVRGFAEKSKLSVRQFVSADPTTTELRLLDAGGRTTIRFVINRTLARPLIDDLGSGASDAVLTARPLEPTEGQALRQRAVASQRLYREAVLALDGLIFIVSPDHQLKSLGTERAFEIYSGAARDWSTTGITAAPIQVFTGSSGHSLLQFVLAQRSLPLGDHVRLIDSEAEMSDTVANDSAALGVTSLAFERNARALTLREACGIESTPSDFAVRSEDYTLSRRLYLQSFVRTGNSALARFIAYAVSEVAEERVREARLVDQGIRQRSIKELLTLRPIPAKAPASPTEQRASDRMAALAKDATRLSVTFRFALASADLDARAQQDILRLRTWLARPEHRGVRLLLAGYSDALGPADLNLGLSLRRAEQVRTAIGPVAALGTTVLADGFGALSPIACNETPEGRRVNRRVEVWMLPAGAPAAPAGPQRPAQAPQRRAALR